MAYFGLHRPSFFLCVFFMMIPMMTKSAMNESDVLIIVKQFLNNPLSLDSWRNGTNPCDDMIKWLGIFCGNGIVTTIHLRSLNLSGFIDVSSLSHLQGLRVINIVNNSFSGPIPEFNKLGALKAIFLSMNQFSGEIPPTYFTNMVSLKKLWFDHNNFSGSIPSSLAKLPRLLELHLENNNFSGMIPSIGQQSLASLNFSDNNLVGPLPAGLSKFDVALFGGNPGLCGPKFSRECVSVIHQSQHHPPSKPPAPESYKMAYSLMGISGFLLVSMIIAIYVLAKKQFEEEAEQLRLHERNMDDSFGLGMSRDSPKEEYGSTETNFENGSPSVVGGGGGRAPSVVGGGGGRAVVI